MSNMAGTTPSSPMKGFSVLQPSLGAPLSWMPAVGTKELEQLINAYLPGSASPQEKRATISMDFFEFAAQTGENFKYYPVRTAAPQATCSPASSTVSASPALSNLSYGSPSQPSTPAPKTASRTSAVKPEKTDYSHLPGMKILTTDGQDVTNSVSRGCKSKEQREHAHLMRVLKACDACKKKKIRCDPSHKRRSSSQLSSKVNSKPAKKRAKKEPSPSASQATSASFTPTPEASVELGMDMSLDMDFGSFPSMDIDDILAFDPEPIDAYMPQDFYGAVPQDFDFFLSNDFSPAMASSNGSFDSPAQPLTPVSSGLFSHGDVNAFNDSSALAFLQTSGQEPSLPYMIPVASHGSNYVDFNLYSPANSFIDEEPQKMKADEKRNFTGLQSVPTSPQSQPTDASVSPTSLTDNARCSTGLVHNDQSRVSRSGLNALNPQEPQWQLTQQQVITAGDEQSDGVVSHGDQRPFHGDDGGHASEHVSTATRPHGLTQKQVVSQRTSSVTDAMLSSGTERNDDSPGSISPGSSMSASATPLTSPRLVRGSSATLSWTDLHLEISSPTTRLARAPISVHSLPLAETVLTASSSTSRPGRVSNDGLHVNGSLQTAGELQSPVLGGRHSLTAAPGCGQSNASTSVPHQTAVPSARLDSASGSAALLRLEAAGSARGASAATATTTPTSGRRSLDHGHQRQALHGMTVLQNGYTASSSPRRREGSAAPLFPMCQWLCQLCTPSGLLTQPAVFGLVSMLLIMGLTALLYLQLQLPVFAHLPSSSLVVLSCISTLSLSPKQGDVDSVRNTRQRQGHPERQRPGLLTITGLARASMVACR